MDHEARETEGRTPSVSPGGGSEAVRKGKRLFFGSLGLLLVLNLFILPHHPHFGLEKVPGFWAAFGFVGALILARLAKGAAHTFLGKDEDFYLKRIDE